MSNAALAFLAGLGQGYFKAKDNEDEKARRQREEQRQQEEHDARMDEAAQKKRERTAVADAGKVQTVDNGATVTGVSANPTVYDNADVASSDVRQANRLAQLPAAAQEGIPGPAAAAPAPASMTAAPVVGGKAYADTASAQAAAAAANTPEARRARQVAALEGINPERALQLQAAGTQVQQGEQAAADQAWRRKVSQAMIDGGHEGLAQLVSSTEHGPAKGVQLKAVPSPDGKTVTYNKVGADGTLTPTGLTFTNDGEGIARAAAALDGAISPADRVKMAQADAKERREVEEGAAKNEEARAKARYYDAAAGLQGAKATGAAGGNAKPFKLDEDDKLRLNEASKGVQEATKAYGEALKALMPGQKPEESPAVAFAAQQLKAAKLTHLRTNIELGQITPEAMANQVLGVAKTSQDVLKSLNELAGVGGADFSDKVATAVQNSDAWKAMNPKKTAAAPAKPAAAAGMPAAAPAAAPKQAATPTDAAGQRLDQAREVLRRLRASAPGLAKGRQAIDDHAAAVKSAEDELAQAEAAYQRMVEGSVKPYFGGPARPAAASGMTATR